MKLARVGEIGTEKPALVDGEGILRDLSGVVADIDPAVLSDAELAKLRAIDPAGLPALPDDVRYGAPVTGGHKFICIGLNYSDHAAETGAKPPKEPIIFMKGARPTGPNDPVSIPRGSVKTDWECELGVVIGTGGLYIPEESALDHVAGYCVVNDVSERDYQANRGGTWTKGKSFPGFGPVGPWLVTRDEVGDPGDLKVWTDLNGKRMQDGTTSNLIFAVPHLIHYVSQFYRLEPGDIIATGTPAGVGLGIKPEPVFLKPGDVLELGVEGLGSQRQEYRAFD
ncbi:MAG: fumarylacetoacetate hydrolase family protein [Alphaproteobacteria bacterium]|nr:fumarylacetoacetate hydrolase family protein [Alphaproteobacteria bacterium]